MECAEHEPPEIVLVDTDGKVIKDPRANTIFTNTLDSSSSIFMKTTLKSLDAPLAFTLFRTKLRSIVRRSEGFQLLKKTSFFSDSAFIDSKREVLWKFFNAKISNVIIRFMGKELIFPLENFLVGCGSETIRQVFFCNQYNITEKNVRNKIVVDAGANVGVFSLVAALYGCKKAYAFEPIESSCELLKENIRVNNMEDVIIPVNKALGEKNFSTSMKYNGKGTVSASLKYEGKNGNDQAVDVISIDSFFKGRRVDFIKIDTEGYEGEILLGAKETIKNHKPVLCFSAYHRPEDKEKLPAIVKGIRPDYNITLLTRHEEDFYCE